VQNNFEQDDFADDKEVQQFRKRDREYWEYVKECVEMVVSGLSVSLVEKETDINTSVLFNSLRTHELVELYESEQDGLQIILAEYNNSNVKNSSGTDHYLLGYLPLQKDYPLTCIYRETIREKIVDLFVKGDVDFKEHKAFSKRFHVVTKDREKLTRLLYNKPLDELVAFPELLLELDGNKCVFRVSPHAINDSDAAKFADLVKTIRRIFR